MRNRAAPTSKRGVRRALAIGMLLATAACTSPPENAYPEDVVENFVSGCRTRTTETVCRCAIDRLQRRYTLSEFQALEEQVAEGRGGQALAETVASCAG